MNVLRRIDGRRVCLTFDDGPDPCHTPRVLDILAQHDCRASFFVLGAAAERWPRLVRRIVDEGHALGSHSFRHRRGWTMRPSRVRLELGRSQRVLADITGRSPRWFRPPHGSRNRVMLGEAARLGMETVLWSRSAVDWGPLASREGVARRLGRVTAGDIVLLHDGKRRYNRPDITATLLPGVLAMLAERGLAPVSLDEARLQGRSERQEGSRRERAAPRSYDQQHAEEADTGGDPLYRTRPFAEQCHGEQRDEQQRREGNGGHLGQWQQCQDDRGQTTVFRMASVIEQYRLRPRT